MRQKGGEKAKHDISVISELFVEHDDKIYNKIMPAVDKFMKLDTSVFHNFPGTGASRKMRRTAGLTSKLTTDVTDEYTTMNENVDVMSNLSVRLAKVEKMIESVDAKTSNKAICFGNVQLRSKKEAKDFVSKMNNPNLRGFYDIISLLDLCHADQTYEEGLDLEFKASRTGYDNVEDASVFLSFRNTLPRVFAGKGENKATNKNPLPGCKSHAEWDSGDGSTGLRWDIMTSVREQRNIIQGDIASLFSEDKEALCLATSFLCNSVAFAEMLIDSFMGELFGELKATSGAKDDEAWGLVTTVVSKMFKWLRVVRMGAASAKSHTNRIDQMAEVIWATGQCNMRMQELTEVGFKHHGVMSSALNHHLFNHRVPLTVHEVAVKRITLLEQQIKVTTSENHALVNKFKDMEKRMTALGQKVGSRNGGGGGGGRGNGNNA